MSRHENPQNYRRLKCEEINLVVSHGRRFLFAAEHIKPVCDVFDGRRIDGHSGSPFPVEALTVQVATDYWSVSVFILLGSALFLLWASRDAGAYINVARYVAWLELMGFGAYVLYSLLRGYEPAGYVAFGIVHLLISRPGSILRVRLRPKPEPTFRPATTD